MIKWRQFTTPCNSNLVPFRILEHICSEYAIDQNVYNITKSFLSCGILKDDRMSKFKMFFL